jgi:hypothetical protein
MLSEASQAAKMPANRAAELAAAMLAKAQSTVVKGAGKSIKNLLMFGGVLLTGGLAYGGWVAFSEPPPVPPTLTSLQNSETPPPVQVLESLQAKNKRLFLNEVRPKLLAAFQSFATGKGGSVELKETDVTCYDTRIECVAIVHHGEPYKFDSRLRAIHETRTKLTLIFVDYLNKGLWKHINPALPIYSEFPKFEIKFPGLGAIAPAFLGTDFIDVRQEEEWAKFSEALSKAASPYLGMWYEEGDPNSSAFVRLIPDDELAIKVRFARGYETGCVRMLLKIRIDGQLEGFNDDGKLDPAGQRLVYGQGRFWTRQPTMAKNKKE